MVKLLLSLLSFVQLALLVSASPAQDRMVQKRQSSSGDITTSQRIPTTNAMLGKQSTQTTINAGVNYWLSGFSTHNTYGNLDVAGNLIISQTDSVVKPYGGMTADFSGSDIQNGNLNIRSGGSILLNDVDAISAPTYDWYLETMSNSGSMQWCGRGDTGGSTFQLYCESNCVNNGAITFEQVKGNLGTAMVWRNDVLTPSSTTPSQTITNNGAFIMRSARVDFVQNFKGGGCWVIDNNAIMYLQDGVGALQNPGFGPSLNGQSVSFTDATGILHMDTAVYSKNSNFGANIYGYQAGNAIEFYETVKTQSYSGSTLTVTMVSGNSVKLNIGAGYDATKFVIRSNKTFYANFNAVFYTGSAPGSSAPSVCNQRAAACSSLAGLTGFPNISSSTSSVSSSTAAPSSSSTSSVALSVSSTSASASSTSSSLSIKAVSSSSTLASATPSIAVSPILVSNSSASNPSLSVLPASASIPSTSSILSTNPTSSSSTPALATPSISIGNIFSSSSSTSNSSAPSSGNSCFLPTQSNLTASASDPSYLSTKMVKSTLECLAYCASLSSCLFANVFKTPATLTPDGNVSCAVFSKCLPASSFTTSVDPTGSPITESYGLCLVQQT